MSRLKACRVIINGLIASHRGRIFNTAGDSVVADFASAVDAVQCAVAVQEAVVAEIAVGGGEAHARDGATSRLSLQATEDGWSLLSPEGEVVFRGFGLAGRRQTCR